MSQFDAIAEARRQWEEHQLGEPLAMAAATSIMRAQQVVLAAVEAVLRPLDLSFARYEVLMLLSFSRRGSLPMTKMGERLMVHPTGITKLVEKLEERGLVARRPNPADRRGVLCAVTAKGRRTGERATAALADVHFGVDLAGPDLEAIVGLMRSVRARSGEFA